VNSKFHMTTQSLVAFFSLFLWPLKFAIHPLFRLVSLPRRCAWLLCTADRISPNQPQSEMTDRDTPNTPSGLLEGDAEILQRSHHAALSFDDPLSHGSHAGVDRSRLIRIAVVILLVLSLIFVIIDSFGEKRVESTILSFLQWVEIHPHKGMLAVICVYILATILFVPGSILTFGTGYAFGRAYQNKVEGIAVASTAVFIGASLGSICTFLLGRYLFRSCVVRLASSYPLFQAIDRALQSNGLKIMVLLRLSPLIPYNALDYMSGITALPLLSYIIALVGILPGTVSLCFIGASASSLTDKSATENLTLKITTIVVGVISAAAGLFVASYYSKRELERILADENAGDELLSDSRAGFQDLDEADVDESNRPPPPVV